MIEYHADDYGLFVEQSKRIIECMDEGVINGISIMPNSPYLEECMELLGQRKPKLTVHLNLVEGKALSESARNLLTDSKGIFNVSFGKLLFVSFAPWMRNKYRLAIKDELGLQIERVKKYFSEAIRLDSHVHYHMIPVVFDAIMDVIHEKELQVSYIRTSAEDTKAFKNCGEDLEKVRPINRIKVIVTNILYKRNYKKYKEYLDSLEQKEFYGILYSSRMNEFNAVPLVAYLKQSGKKAEVLFHPGAVLEEKDIEALTSRDDVNFLTSDDRRMEAKATKMLKSIE